MRNETMEGVIINDAAELEAFAAFKAEKARKEKEEKIKQDREALKVLTDETVKKLFPSIESTSADLASRKKDIYTAFASVLELKKEVYEIDQKQASHTFTSIDGKYRITLGYHSVDSYDDTANEGIAKVKEYIESLAKDTTSKLLVNTVLKLLSQDAKGTLKPSRVAQLRKLADESRNPEFIDGVKIIADAYNPQRSKQYVRAEYKNGINEWVSIPLGMTEAEF